MVSRATLTHRRPSFGITESKVGNRVVPVREEEVFATPFGTLLRFAKEGVPAQPRVLLVAPLSGHFATLLRDTVRVLLPEHDVHITDWANARDVGIWHGRFGFDEYVEHLIVVPARHGAGRACRGRVPALRAGAGGGGADGRGRPSLPARCRSP